MVLKGQSESSALFCLIATLVDNSQGSVHNRVVRKGFRNCFCSKLSGTFIRGRKLESVLNIVPIGAIIVGFFKRASWLVVLITRLTRSGARIFSNEWTIVYSLLLANLVAVYAATPVRFL